MLSAPAWAAEEDPCQGREVGDPCVRANGQPGMCRSDPVRGGLTCGEASTDGRPPYAVEGDDDGPGASGEDTDAADDDDAGGCDHTGGRGLLAAWMALAGWRWTRGRRR